MNSNSIFQIITVTGYQDFIESLKSEVSPGQWSRGIAQSRLRESFHLTSVQKSEVKALLKNPSRPLALEITLWLEDQDSFCSCGAKVIPCEHVIGFAIALPFLSATKKQGIQYRFLPNADLGFELKRWIIQDQDETPLMGSLVGHIAGIKSGRIQGKMPLVSPEDLRLDEELSKRIEDQKPIVIWNTLRNLRVDPPVQNEKTKLRFESKGSEIVILHQGPTWNTSLPSIQWQLHEGTLFYRCPTLPTELSAALFSNWYRKHEADLKTYFQFEEPTEHLAQEKVFQDIDLDQDVILSRQMDPNDPSFEWIRADMKAPKSGHAYREEDLRRIHHELQNRLGLKLGVPHRLNRVEAEWKYGNRSTLKTPLSDEALRFLREFFENRRVNPAQKKWVIQSFQSSNEDQPKPGEDFPVVPAVQKHLREYQHIGAQFLSDHGSNTGGALLSDDMGLGKTIQTLSVLKTPALIVAPKSLLFQWRQEIHKYRPDLVSHFDQDLILMTPGLLRNQKDSFFDRIFKTCVLDEAHLIRNENTLIHQTLLKVKADFRIALTGTPIQNSQEDLRMIFKFIQPAWADEFVSFSKDALKPYILRRLKSDVLSELPAKIQIRHTIELKTEDQERYQALETQLDPQILREEKSFVGAFEKLLRLRQLCNHPSLVDPRLKVEESEKERMIFQVIEDSLESGDSILVYSQWTKFLDRLEANAQLKGYDSVRLDGQTANRESIVEKFQTAQTPMVFFISLHAGGVGLNLTAANQVLFCDSWWNPKVEEQCEDRAYRMGQKKTVLIHRIITRNTVEEMIENVKSEKLFESNAWMKAFQTEP